MPRPTDNLSVGIQYRTFELDRSAINDESRTVELSFSSEAPVERWFGNEILDHSRKAIRLGRLKSGGPVLMDHDPKDQVGVVEKVWVDSASRVARASVRFGRSARAEEIFTDVKDGIRSSVSVGYQIYNAKEESAAKEGVPATYRMTDWEPMEISLVAVPADIAVGVGRDRDESPVEVPVERINEMPENVSPEVPAPAATSVDIKAVRSDGEKAERARVRDILAIGKQTKCEDIASSFIDNGGSLDSFRQAVLARMTEREDIAPVREPVIGMDNRQVREYSMLRLIRALGNPNDRRAQEDATLEFEAGAAFARVAGRDPSGIFIPGEVLKAPGRRDLLVGTAGSGGYTVGTDIRPDAFVDLLRNSAVTMQLGTILSGLSGSVRIPTQSGASTAYWVNEGTGLTASNPSFGQITLAPRTVGGYVKISRLLLQQTSLDVESLVRNDLAAVIALAIDAAAINGTTTNRCPNGIMNTASVGTVVMGTDGAKPTWASVVEYESDINVANAAQGRLAFLTNSKVVGQLKQIQKGTSLDFIWNNSYPAAPLNGYPVYMSNNVPSNLTKGTSSGVCSAMIFGNWTDLLFGLWSGLDLLVDPYTSGTEGAIKVQVMQNVDIALRRPESFTFSADILTA